MHYRELSTPALLIDREIMEDNLRFMQDYADSQGVALRPHTKTHKMASIARRQAELGARGITVAKVGEAEAMAAEGLTDIFIANEVVGDDKLARVRKLAETIDISFGLDSIEQADLVERAFAGGKPARVVIEIEVGEERSGIIEESDFRALLAHLKTCPHIQLLGVFSHEGHCYNVESKEACREAFEVAVNRTLDFAHIMEEQGFPVQVVSIGSTPSLMFGFDIPKGVTEMRPGTYVLMDASQGHAIGTLDRCAATILTTVISRPTAERVITDVGAKGITAQTRTKGICATPGLGLIKGYEGVHVFDVYDEHAIIYHAGFREAVRVGDKVEFYPNHICPVVNLYDRVYLVSGGEVVEELKVTCRGLLT